MGEARPARKRRKDPSRPPAGSAPGTLTPDPKAKPPRIRVIAYGPESITEHPLREPDQIAELMGRSPVTWIDVDGLGDARIVGRIGELIGLHKLSLADVVHVNQRPKLEDYGNYLFLVARMPCGEADNGALATEQVSICLGPNFVVTFQERQIPGDCFDPVRDRLRRAIGRIRRSGADHLAYALLDAVIDAYFPVVEEIGERIDTLEEAVLGVPTPEVLQQIHRVRRDLIAVRRAAWPLREAVNTLLRDPSPLVADETRVYLRDCHDHTIQIIDLVESYRDLESALMDVYLSMVSYRLNEIMKVLTIIATIFIPLTFIVGLYGMNFDTSSPWNMPELGWRYGYPAVLLVMAVIAGGMLVFFRRRGWLGGSARPGRPAKPPAMS